MLLGALEPLFGGCGQLLVGPVAVFVRLGRVDHAGDVPRAGEHEPRFSTEELRPRVRRLPRRDMVLDRRYEIRRNGDLRHIDWSAGQRDAAGLAQLVPHVHVAEVKAVHLRRHPRRVLVPVQEIERKGVASHEVIVDDERPDQIVAAEHVEGVRHVRTFEIAALAHLALER